MSERKDKSCGGLGVGRGEARERLRRATRAAQLLEVHREVVVLLRERADHVSDLRVFDEHLLQLPRPLLRRARHLRSQLLHLRNKLLVNNGFDHLQNEYNKYIILDIRKRTFSKVHVY